ncbi:hypothetical protein [Streptomyces armeniacus]
MAHGVAGPVALLALCARAGHTVPGQYEALVAACRLLEEWARPRSPLVEDQQFASTHWMEQGGETTQVQLTARYGQYD